METVLRENESRVEKFFETSGLHSIQLNGLSQMESGQKCRT